VMLLSMGRESSFEHLPLKSKMKSTGGPLFVTLTPCSEIRLIKAGCWHPWVSIPVD
jgi:hypothetical protein